MIFCKKNTTTRGPGHVTESSDKEDAEHILQQRLGTKGEKERYLAYHFIEHLSKSSTQSEQSEIIKRQKSSRDALCYESNEK